MALDVAEVPDSDLDPYASDVLRYPYDAYAELRGLGPVVRLTRYNVLCMARHGEVQQILGDWETFSSAAGVGLDDLRKGNRFRPKSLLLEADPPVHDKTRAAMNRVLSRPALKRMRDAFADEAEQLVDRLVARGSFDGVTDLATPYVLKVFPDAVGLAKEGREHLLPWGDMAFNSFGPNNERFRKSAENAETVKAYIFDSSTRDALVSDGFGRAIFDMVDEGRLEEAEGEVLIRSMLTAGLDTTVTGLSAALYAFARHPAQWDILRADPSLIRPAFDEVVRWAGPVQTFFRTTTRDTEIAGTPIPADSKVLLVMAAANRDEAVFPDPERFDITRDARAHVGFGHGIHKCVGQMVAKLEAEVVFEALIRRVGRFELSGDVDYHLNNTVRAFASIPLQVTAA